ncbi:hypothetical protein LL270_16795 [Pseudomonas aestusnigri]|uniref:hypothetical protein n=1 Tax=Halopseudomonas aestusnigri TaxID=857252 RepID=UPI001D181F15|nr:hypothetical protein [Halopseudomonas aestusnigri]MCC4262292.1 hypothetical protein [Halopseudomonas aestusnigri]
MTDGITRFNLVGPGGSGLTLGTCADLQPQSGGKAVTVLPIVRAALTPILVAANGWHTFFHPSQKQMFR